MVVDPTGVKVRVKFGDSKSNRSQDISTASLCYKRRRPTDPMTIGQNAFRQSIDQSINRSIDRKICVMKLVSLFIHSMASLVVLEFACVGRSHLDLIDANLSI